MAGCTAVASRRSVAAGVDLLVRAAGLVVRHVVVDVFDAVGGEVFAWPSSQRRFAPMRARAFIFLRDFAPAHVETATYQNWATL